MAHALLLFACIRQSSPRTHSQRRAKALLQDNLASLHLTLSADQLKTLDEASRIELGFPHDFYAKEGVRALAYAGLRDQVLTQNVIAEKRNQDSCEQTGQQLIFKEQPER